MKTVINTSSVTDYSGEPPVVTYSNPVTTVIRQTQPSPIFTRIFYRLSCDCCCDDFDDCFDDCCCNCCDDCCGYIF